MRLPTLAVVAVLTACSTRVQQDGVLAQPTVAFPQAWAQDEAKEEKAPAGDEAVGRITSLCCETAKAGADGNELTGCKVIEGDAAAQNACIESGKTLKKCKDAECSGARCRCSN